MRLLKYNYSENLINSKIISVLSSIIFDEKTEDAFFKVFNLFIIITIV